MADKKTYAIVTYHRIPRDPTKTHDKEYVKDPGNWQYDEKLIIANKIKNNDITSAGVILNLTDGVMIKNRITPDKGYDELLEYYRSNYPKFFEDLAILSKAEEKTDEQEE